MYKPECNSPLLLVNRSAINMIFHGCQLYIAGRPSRYVTRSNVNDYPVSVLLALARKMSSDELNACYVERGSYREPLFIYVPCGHCILCRNRKYVDFISRCNMESQLYSCPPFFVTLTYRPADLPPRGDLHYKDIQDFFKRLRRKWDSKGLQHNLRYVCACEYGSRTHRAHYHLILWNNPYNATELTPKQFHAFRDDVFTAWSHCDAAAFDFGQCAGGAAGYVAKYISKPPHKFGHLVSPSIHTSTGHGGIGSGLIKSKAAFYHDNPQLRVFTYYDVSKEDYVNQNFGQYITTHLWPSPSRLVPARVRSAYKEFCDLVQIGFSLSFLSLQQGYEYCELLRPYKNVVVNRFSSIPCIPSSFPSCKEVFSRYLMSHFEKSLVEDALKMFVSRLSSRPLTGLCYLWYRARFARYLDALSDDILVDYKDALIDVAYIENYYKYKSLNVETKREDSAFHLLKLREKYSREKEKETL